jgi:tetratricopeptide (TPR) repeat protein
MLDCESHTLRKLLKQRKNEKVIELLSNAIEQDESKTNIKYHYYIGIAYSRTKQHETALTHLQTFLKEISHPDAMFYATRCLFSLKRYEECATMASQAIGLYPKSYVFYHFKGLAHLMLQQYDQAVEELATANYYLQDEIVKENYCNALLKHSEALLTNGDVKRSAYYKARMYNELEQHEEALVCTQAALELTDWGHLYMVRAKSYQRLGRYEDALQSIEHANQRTEHRFYATRIKIKCLKCLKRYEEALTVVDNLIEESKDKLVPMHDKAYLLYCMERYDDSLRLYRTIEDQYNQDETEIDSTLKMKREIVAVYVGRMRTFLHKNRVYDVDFKFV